MSKLISDARKQGKHAAFLTRKEARAQERSMQQAAAEARKRRSKEQWAEIKAIWIRHCHHPTEPLTPDHLDTMFGHLAKLPTLMRKYQSQIVPEMFRDDEAHYAMLWTVMVELSRANISFTYRRISKRLNQALETSPGVKREAVTFVEYVVFGVFDSKLLHYEANGEALLARFVRQRSNVGGGKLS